ncbi:basal cell adhesion molecule (Lutheran blood group) [Rhinolophus ferrumequinum]|uniref:Basal cell adhesion molecule (Lutheran blood group) n=1 Tax=Rhinolophus ferrumequinum TaxID=59479 RepID=A0A7J7SH40_RHIFE|nr:basal cell adhesion molecule (Lutheran blood group) [Rhinolophus ferrumequinum]
MEPPNAQAGTRGAPQLLVLALLLGAHPGTQAEVQMSVPPLREVMRGETVTLDCTPLGAHDHFVLEWFLADRSGARHLLASAELQGSEIQARVHNSRGRNPPYQLDSRGRLVLAEAQVGDEQDYVCVVRAGAAGTAEATARLQVFAKPEATEVSHNQGMLSVMDEYAQEIATCNSRNGNPAPQIIWYRNRQPLQVPMEVNPESYMTSRTVREASGLLSLTSTLYLRVHKTDQDAFFHCSAHYRLPNGQHGRLDSPSFNLTLHYPTEHVQFWVDSPSTTEGWVREGDSVHLFCRGDGSSNSEYAFYRLQDKQENMLQTNYDGHFTLEGVQRSQSGTYGCTVEDYDAADDAELSQTLELRVAYLDPIELSNEEELSLPLGSSIATNCSVQGLPTPALRWTKDSVPLGDGPTLSLSFVTFDSAGTYICEASMPTVPLLSRTQALKLLVEGSPELRPEEIQPKAEGSWREGDEVRLVCSARGYPEPKLRWNQLGGSAAEPAPGGQGWVSSSLTLKVTSALSQEGVFCEASNPHGTTKHVFHFGTVAPQTSQAGVAVMAVAVSVGLLLLVVAAFYCMRRKGRPGRQGEKGALPPGKPELSHSGSQRTEQTGLLTGSASGGVRHGSGGFRDEC